MLSFLTGGMTKYALLGVVVLLLVWLILRNVRQIIHPRKSPEVVFAGEVQEVLAGNQLVVGKQGILRVLTDEGCKVVEETTEAVESRRRRGITVTVSGIAVPRKDQPYGPESISRLLKLCPLGSRVSVTVPGKRRVDRDGVTGSVITAENWDVATAMLQRGDAWCARDCTDSTYWRLEKEAQAERLGLWEVYKRVSQ